MKRYKEFINESITNIDGNVKWEVLEKIGEVFHDKILKNKELKDIYLDSDELDGREWDIEDINANIEHLEIAFNFYFVSIAPTDFYISNADKEIDKFKNMCTQIKNVFKRFDVRIKEVAGKYSSDTQVTVFITKNNMMDDPNIKNLLSSIKGIEKYNL